MAFKIHLLDVGHIEYGDAILCEVDSVTILLDGGKKASGKGADTPNGVFRPIQEQIRRVLGQDAAHVNLLVMTHCHSDHIGCLPRLIADGELTCDWALMADPNLGFGKLPGEPDEPLPDSMPLSRKLAFAMREEPIPDASDEEIEDAVEDNAGQYNEYVEFLATLSATLGDQLVLYRGPSEADSPGLNALLQQFPAVRVLGPTREQLGACAEVIRDRFIDAVEDAERRLRTDTAAHPAALYRAMLAGEEDALVDGSSEGKALNCQSIVLAVEGEGAKALLTGDMQFAAPGLGAEVQEMVNALIEAVTAAGPYTFIKLSHHASDNGFDGELLDAWGAERFGISTGSNSKHHPREPVLELLRTTARAKWIRNDRNGRCSWRFENGTSRFSVQRGTTNDASGPAGLDVVEAAGTAASTVPQVVHRPAPGPSDVVEVVARIPTHVGRVTITVDIQGVAPPAGDGRGPFERPASDRRLGGGRSLPRLLFVTNPAILARNIGAAEAAAALEIIERSGQPVVRLTGGDSRASAPLVHAAVRARRDIEGIVLVGGYDVVPPSRVDCLTSELRASANFEEEDDSDDFFVWSDDTYGDLDGAGLAELPVSRIPDGLRAELVLNALQASLPASVGVRRGIRNLNRAFAESTFQRLPGRTPLLTADPLRLGQPVPLSGDVAYVMLHGDYRDATVYHGEDTGRRQHRAFDLSGVQPPVPAVVFAGCCWGALTVDRLANGEVAAGFGVRGPDQSIALRYLMLGTDAFVGCTGSHYSPAPTEPLCYGAPMHAYFFDEVVNGAAPARALLRAKERYSRSLPHLGTAATQGDLMVELKMLRQFTCLGLGW